jgi:hypothetical protein
MTPAHRLLLASLALIVALASVPLRAHELQPGFLELREVGPGSYETLWKLPSLGSSDVRMPIAPVFPASCRQLGEARSDRAGTAWVFTARLQCKESLAGQTIGIEGLEAFTTDVLVRVQQSRCAAPARRAAASAPICTWASSTSCSASTTCCSCSACC